ACARLGTCSLTSLRLIVNEPATDMLEKKRLVSPASEAHSHRAMRFAPSRRDRRRAVDQRRRSIVVDQCALAARLAELLLDVVLLVVFDCESSVVALVSRSGVPPLLNIFV